MFTLWVVDFEVGFNNLLVILFMGGTGLEESVYFVWILGGRLSF